MRFLTDTEIQAEVRRIASRSGEVMAAVAYWGKGAAKRTGLTKNDDPKNVRVICDLLSGACNPSEIEALTGRGFQVQKLDRLHAKVWIGGDDFIVGSANASRTALPGEDEQAADSTIEAAIVSRDPRMARDIRTWFERQWCASSEITPANLDQAWQLWKRRRRSTGRGFTATLIQKILNPGPLDDFSDLRLIAYPREEVSQEAVEFVNANAGLYYTDDERQELGDEYPWYEWPRNNPVWTHPPGTVFMDFNCDAAGGEFTFNGFWQVRACPPIRLKKVRLTLLTRLPHYNGYSLSRQEETAIARRIQETAAQPGHRADRFGSYIDENFLEFWETERPELREWLLGQVVEAARELCRTGQFDPSLTLQAIRVCKEDPEWLAGYTRFVGGGIYRRGNPVKRLINPGFGQRVKAGVGAEDQEDDNDRTVRAQVNGEIIQSYTLFRDFDRNAVEAP